MLSGSKGKLEMLNKSNMLSCVALATALTVSSAYAAEMAPTEVMDPPTFNINQITSFGEDAFGELYIIDRGGELFKIVPDVPGGIVGDDCIIATARELAVN